MSSQIRSDGPIATAMPWRTTASKHSPATGPTLAALRRLWDSSATCTKRSDCRRPISALSLPYYAYLLKGARFLRIPLLKYRVHAQNSSLSLIAEKSPGLEHELRAKERTFAGHLAHSVLMQEELDRLSATMPERFAELAPKIAPTAEYSNRGNGEETRQNSD